MNKNFENFNEAIDEFEKKVIELIKAEFPEAEVSAQYFKKMNTTIRGAVINIGNVSPVVYFKDLIGKGTLEDAVKAEAERVKESLKSAPSINMITPSSVLENVRFRLLNAERNKGILTTSPHKRWFDLALIPYVEFDEKDRTMSVRVTYGFLEAFNLKENEIMEICEKKTDTVKYTISEALGITDIFDFDDFLVVTNKRKMYGANEALNKTLLKDIAEEFDDDVVLLPSSLHEMLLLPAKSSKSFAIDMVRDVNSTEVKEEDFLSDNAYLYSRVENRFFELGGELENE